MITYKKLLQLPKEDVYDVIQSNLSYKFKVEFLNYFYDNLDFFILLLNGFLQEQILSNNIAFIKSKFIDDKRINDIYKNNRTILLTKYQNSYYRNGIFENILQKCFELSDEQREKLFYNVTPWIRHAFTIYDNLSDAFTYTFIKQWQCCQNVYSEYSDWLARDIYDLNDFTITLFKWEFIKSNSRILFDLVNHNYDLLDNETQELIVQWLKKILMRKSFKAENYETELQGLPLSLKSKLNNELFIVNIS